MMAGWLEGALLEISDDTLELIGLPSACCRLGKR